MNKKSKVLIVDDNTINLQILNAKFSKLGYEIVLAHDGVEAIEEIENHKNIDLIILDLIMPKYDGFEVIDYLRKHENLRKIPIIVNSGLSEISFIEKALKLGAYDYFVKPLSKDDMHIRLPLKVKNAIGRKKLMEELDKNHNILVDELQRASQFQRLQLPKNVKIEKISYSYKYIPSTHLGGDFFDVHNNQDGSTTIFIADVSGHGVQAALITMMMKSQLNYLNSKNLPPNEYLDFLNTKMNEALLNDEFVTAFMMKWYPEESKMVYASAGHPNMMIYKKRKNEIELLKSTGFFLGIMPFSDYKTENIDLNSGDMIFLFTDGIFEYKNKEGEEWGLEKFKDFIVNSDIDNIDSFIDKLMLELSDFGRDSDFEKDDITLAVFKIN